MSGQAAADPAIESVLPSSGTGIELELSLHPDDVARLFRAGALATLRGTPSRPAPLLIVWHDSADSALSGMGLALTEQRLGAQLLWRLEQARPDAGSWQPGHAAAVLAEAASPEALAPGVAPELLPDLAPVAAFRGQQRNLRLPPDAPVSGVRLRHGVLRAVTDEVPVARLSLTGEADAVFALALALAEQLRLCVPASSLAAEALAVARPLPPQAPPEAPRLAPDLTVGDAFGQVMGQLTAVILHFAPQIVVGVAPVPVHQTRVALRRMRSAMSLFRRAVDCPELEAAQLALKSLAKPLGPARDWDVFTAGTGRAVGAAFNEDRAVQRLLAAAERQRGERYAALVDMLQSADFRRLGLTLGQIAMTRPWQRAASAEAVSDGCGGMPAGIAEQPLAEADLRAYAAHALSRRLRHVLAAGEHYAELSADDLHQLRIQCKRLRYACEFFAPLFHRRDSRRVIRRLSLVQERLGHLNDGSMAGGLMAQLGGGGGGERSFATGVVRGFVAARTQGAWDKAQASWRKFQREKPFWH